MFLSVNINQNKADRPFHKLCHFHVVKLIESQWDLGSIFKNSVRVMQSFKKKSFGNQSPWQ